MIDRLRLKGEMMSEKPLPIAEEFHSVKGEGLWTGTPMKFIRLAGCNVGRPDPFDAQSPSLFPVARHKLCYTYDGRPFICDTNFQRHYSRTPEQLLADVYEKRIVLTGGEPLMYELEELASLAFHRGLLIHLETSGTVSLPDWAISKRVWIAVSPKLGAIPDVVAERSTLGYGADEIKILINEHFSLDKLFEVLPGVKTHSLVWLMPVNGIRGINKANLQSCLELLKQRPDWRLCPQMHKLIGVK